MTWATSVPILVFMWPFVLELGAICTWQTSDRRQTKASGFKLELELRGRTLSYVDWLLVSSYYWAAAKHYLPDRAKTEAETIYDAEPGTRSQWDTADTLKKQAPISVTTSNLVVRRQWIHTEIEVNHPNWRALRHRSPCGGVADPLDMWLGKTKRTVKSFRTSELPGVKSTNLSESVSISAWCHRQMATVFLRDHHAIAIVELNIDASSCPRCLTWVDYKYCNIVAYNDVGVSRRRPELATINCSAHAWRHHRAFNSQLLPACDVTGGQ